MVLGIVTRHEIVRGLIDAMQDTNSIDSTELSEFVDCLYGVKQDRWARVKVRPQAIIDICRKSGAAVFTTDLWSAKDGSKVQRFRLLTTDPPPVVLYAPRNDIQSLVVVDGRHRIVAAIDRGLIEAYVPLSQVGTFAELSVEGQTTGD